MSMLDSFFNKGFKGSKCSTLLKLTMPRIKLLRNRREIQLRQMRRDIAKLLQSGQEATARIRVEHIIREENMMAAQEILELFSELIAVRVPIIEAQRECPLDLKEAISSVCFAAPRCADLPELQQVQLMFAAKYGKEFVSAATGLMPDCGVNRQLIELLSVRAPAPEKKLKLLKDIAEEHNLDWDPADTETEFFKQPEDLLNGPTQFVSGSTLPLPKEKHEECVSTNPDQASKEDSDDDTGFDQLDFPEVPKAIVRPGADPASAPAIVPPIIPNALQTDIKEDPSKLVGGKDNPLLMQQFDFEELEPDISMPSEHENLPNIQKDAMENKQFLPFVLPPSSLSKESHSHTQTKSPPALLKKNSEVDVDLQDVLAAAQAAAESAEKAAAAARSAASLAQIRISEIVKRKNDQDSKISWENPFPLETHNEPANAGKQYLDNQDSEIGWENPFPLETRDELANTGKQQLDHQDSRDRLDDIPYSPDPYYNHEDQLDVPSFDSPKGNVNFSLPNDHVHQPQRLDSMEEDAYSYPNLFSSQGSHLGSGGHSFNNDIRPSNEL